MHVHTETVGPVLGHIQHAKAGYFVQVWLVRRPKQTQSASTPMYNIVMTFFFALTIVLRR